jgi:hypothetical protein
MRIDVMERREYVRMVSEVVERQHHEMETARKRGGR